MGNNARVLTSEQRPQFVTHYNRSSFAFDHSLHLLDIFDVPQLVAMSGRLPDQAYYSTADSVVSDGWKHVGERRAPLAQTLETLSETNSLVLLKHCVEQVGDELRSDLDVGRATLVISSPRRVTSYHIDAEVNFLLQVRGRKLLHAFDPSDRRILTESELEAFYGGDSDGARYKSDRQSEARVFALTPGMGIHLPLHAPHWAQNLDDVSVGVSLNFNLRSGTRLAKLYKVNNRLRRAGMAPASPGVSAWLDSLKLAAFDGASHCRQLVRHRSVKAALS